MRLSVSLLLPTKRCTCMTTDNNSKRKLLLAAAWLALDYEQKQKKKIE
jgi:hypothetical protein